MIADFIPAWKRHGRALIPPAQPGGHGDQGVMGLNYRNAPVTRRSGLSRVFVVIQISPSSEPMPTTQSGSGSCKGHTRSRIASRSTNCIGCAAAKTDSIYRNQQTTGIAEAFTFINQAPLTPDDYMYKLSGADGLWLGR